MAKKRSKYTSNGERSNVSSSTLSTVRHDRTVIDKMLNKIAAWKKGLNPWITVETAQKNTKFVKVRARTLWGDPRDRYNIYGKVIA